jgi:hypothetical protein
MLIPPSPWDAVTMAWANQRKATELVLEDVFGMKLDRVDPVYLELFQDANPTLLVMNLARKCTEADMRWAAVLNRAQT